MGLLLSLGFYRTESDDKQQPPFWTGKLWAQYSPYAPVGKYEAPNHGCDITQVNIVSKVPFFFSLFFDCLPSAPAPWGSIPNCQRKGVIPRLLGQTYLRTSIHRPSIELPQDLSRRAWS